MLPLCAIDSQQSGAQKTSSVYLDSQGTAAQGVRVEMPETSASAGQHARALQGTALGNLSLNGDYLTGIKASENGSGPTIVTVLGFHGDEVEASVRKPSGKIVDTTLQPQYLAGMEWIEPYCDSNRRCANIRYRIASIVEDRSQNRMRGHASNSDVWLYEVEYNAGKGPESDEWKNVCAARNGEGAKGIFVDGRLQSDGSWRPRGYTFACSGAVVAKCVRTWGYKPWKSLEAENGDALSLEPLHRACVRAARADYCGTGISFTRDGTTVDLFDSHGFNVKARAPGFHPEAKFDEHGAVSVKRTRWPIDESDLGHSVALPGCVRPKWVSGEVASPALVSIWSNPRLGRTADR